MTEGISLPSWAQLEALGKAAVHAVIEEEAAGKISEAELVKRLEAYSESLDLLRKVDIYNGATEQNGSSESLNSRSIGPSMDLNESKKPQTVIEMRKSSLQQASATPTPARGHDNPLRRRLHRSISFDLSSIGARGRDSNVWNLRSEIQAVPSFVELNQKTKPTEEKVEARAGEAPSSDTLKHATKTARLVPDAPRSSDVNSRRRVNNPSQREGQGHGCDHSLHIDMSGISKTQVTSPGKCGRCWQEKQMRSRRSIQNHGNEPVVSEVVSRDKIALKRTSGRPTNGAKRESHGIKPWRHNMRRVSTVSQERMRESASEGSLTAPPTPQTPSAWAKSPSRDRVRCLLNSTGFFYGTRDCKLTPTKRAFKEDEWASSRKSCALQHGTHVGHDLALTGLSSSQFREEQPNKRGNSNVSRAEAAQGTAPNKEIRETFPSSRLQEAWSDLTLNLSASCKKSMEEGVEGNKGLPSTTEAQDVCTILPFTLLSEGPGSISSSDRAAKSPEPPSKKSLGYIEGRTANPQSSATCPEGGKQTTATKGCKGNGLGKDYNGDACTIGGGENDERKLAEALIVKLRAPSTWKPDTLEGIVQRAVLGAAGALERADSINREVASKLQFPRPNQDNEVENFSGPESYADMDASVSLVELASRAVGPAAGEQVSRALALLENMRPKLELIQTEKSHSMKGTGDTARAGHDAGAGAQGNPNSGDSSIPEKTSPGVEEEIYTGSRSSPAGRVGKGSMGRAGAIRTTPAATGTNVLSAQQRKGSHKRSMTSTGLSHRDVPHSHPPGGSQVAATGRILQRVSISTPSAPSGVLTIYQPSTNSGSRQMQQELCKNGMGLRNAQVRAPAEPSSSVFGNQNPPHFFSAAAGALLSAHTRAHFITDSSTRSLLGSKDIAALGRKQRSSDRHATCVPPVHSEETAPGLGHSSRRGTVRECKGYQGCTTSPTSDKALLQHNSLTPAFGSLPYGDSASLPRPRAGLEPGPKPQLGATEGEGQEGRVPQPQVDNVVPGVNSASVCQQGRGSNPASQGIDILISLFDRLVRSGVLQPPIEEKVVCRGSSEKPMCAGGNCDTCEDVGMAHKFLGDCKRNVQEGKPKVCSTTRNGRHDDANVEAPDGLMDRKQGVTDSLPPEVDENQPITEVAMDTRQNLRETSSRLVGKAGNSCHAVPNKNAPRVEGGERGPLPAGEGLGNQGIHPIRVRNTVIESTSFVETSIEEKETLKGSTKSTCSGKQISVKKENNDATGLPSDSPWSSATGDTPAGARIGGNSQKESAKSADTSATSAATCPDAGGMTVAEWEGVDMWLARAWCLVGPQVRHAWSAQDNFNAVRDAFMGSHLGGGLKIGLQKRPYSLTIPGLDFGKVSLAGGREDGERRTLHRPNNASDVDQRSKNESHLLSRATLVVEVTLWMLCQAQNRSLFNSKLQEEGQWPCLNSSGPCVGDKEERGKENLMPSVSLSRARKFVQSCKLVQDVHLYPVDIDIAFTRWARYERDHVWTNHSSQKSSRDCEIRCPASGLPSNNCNRLDGADPLSMPRPSWSMGPGGASFSRGAECDAPGCSREARYGNHALAPARVCHYHKQDRMVDILGCRCSHTGCTRLAVGGKRSGNGAQGALCAAHQRGERLHVEGFAFILFCLAAKREERLRRSGRATGVSTEAVVDASQAHFVAALRYLLLTLTGQSVCLSAWKNAPSSPAGPAHTKPPAPPGTPATPAPGSKEVCSTCMDEAPRAAIHESLHALLPARQDDTNEVLELAAASTPKEARDSSSGGNCRAGKDTDLGVFAGNVEGSVEGKLGGMGDTEMGRRGTETPQGRTSWGKDEVDQDKYSSMGAGGIQAENLPPSPQKHTPSFNDAKGPTILVVGGSPGSRLLPPPGRGARREETTEEGVESAPTKQISPRMEVWGEPDSSNELDWVSPAMKREQKEVVKKIMGQEKRTLMVIFNHFSSPMSCSTPRGVRPKGKAKRFMSLQQLFRFCRAYEILPGLATTQELLSAYKEVMYPGVVGITDAEVGYCPEAFNRHWTGTCRKPVQNQVSKDHHLHVTNQERTSLSGSSKNFKGDSPNDNLSQTGDCRHFVTPRGHNQFHSYESIENHNGQLFASVDSAKGGNVGDVVDYLGRGQRFPLRTSSRNTVCASRPSTCYLGQNAHVSATGASYHWGRTARRERVSESGLEKTKVQEKDQKREGGEVDATTESDLTYDLFTEWLGQLAFESKVLRAFGASTGYTPHHNGSNYVSNDGRRSRTPRANESQKQYDTASALVKVNTLLRWMDCSPGMDLIRREKVGAEIPTFRLVPLNAFN